MSADKINDGGPAYPVQEWNADGTPATLMLGVSMRDWFAAKAPPPPKWWMDSYAKDANDLDAVADTIAQWNYVYADAMLKKRSA